MEKNATTNRPILAILADAPVGSAQYMAQLAAMAGWDAQIVPPAPGGVSVRIGKDGQLTFIHDGKSLSFTTPIKATKIIQHLQAIQKQSGALPDKIAIGTYSLHPQDYLLIDQDEQALRLTEKETAILVFLSQQKSAKPVTRQALLDAVWGYAEGVETHTLETHIYRLRQKIEVDPANPKTLITLEDGYCLAG